MFLQVASKPFVSRDIYMSVILYFFPFFPPSFPNHSLFLKLFKKSSQCYMEPQPDSVNIEYIQDFFLQHQVCFAD